MTSTSIYSVIPDSNPQTKICSKCDKQLSIDMFYKQKMGLYGVRANCKGCCKAYNLDNIEHKKIYDTSYNRNNRNNSEQTKECGKIRSREYYQENKTWIKEWIKEYKQANSGMCNAHNVKRKATKLSATPKWVELDLIKQLYIDRELISEMTGIMHHIDHIVPLNSKIVCGLHCLSNLRIIPAEENLSKSNSYWPDMPC